MENRLCDLLNKAVSPFACVKAAKDELIECGFEEINYADKWKIKAGGKYVSAVGAVKKIDDFERLITMQDGAKIPMDDVLSIDGELFSTLE